MNGARWNYPRRTKQRTGCPLIAWQADTVTMHPVLDPGIIAAGYADDPVAQRSSTEEQFRSDFEGYLARDGLDAAIVPDEHGPPTLPACPHRACEVAARHAWSQPRRPDSHGSEGLARASCVARRARRGALTQPRRRPRAAMARTQR